MLANPCELLGFDPLHARVEPPELPLRKGMRIWIHHEFPFGYRERRYAQINRLEPYTIGFGELRAPGRRDYFPHSYSFTLDALGSAECIVQFRLRGRFRIPAARWWWLPWFRWSSPRRTEQALARLEASLLRGMQGEPALRGADGSPVFSPGLSGSDRVDPRRRDGGG